MVWPGKSSPEVPPSHSRPPRTSWSSSPWSQASVRIRVVKGLNFTPRSYSLFRYIGPGPKLNLVWVKNVQASKSKYRIAEQELLLETEFLHPLVKGPYIERFRHAYDGLLAAFPYDESSIRTAQLGVTNFGGALLYCCRTMTSTASCISAQTGFSDIIRGPDPGEFYGLARTGPYSFAEVYVGFRDNTKWRACVIESASLPWDEDKRFVFQNHAVSVCERPQGGFISREEAHYLCAILNAPTVERFIYASSDNRSFKIRPPVYVPRFDDANAQHRQLASLSRAAHAEPTSIDSLRVEIDSVYLDLCRAHAGRDSH